MLQRFRSYQLAVQFYREARAQSARRHLKRLEALPQGRPAHAGVFQYCSKLKRRIGEKKPSR